ncbi:MAG TPA: UDP-3-O-(3-hydroxymyristoyl)glucosamine N-acyltransferase [Phnomibacter sp.]|nr:UDP-3-O-(3-hydroxymyristoyl)glucosamine N-acyltransferase [Phnomibacter sp.]
MKFASPVTVQWVADLIGATIIGEPTSLISGINEIHKVEPGDLVFVDHPKYYEKCLKSDASFIIIDRPVEDTFGKTLLVCPQPFEAYLTIVRHFRPFVSQEKMISDTAVIGNGTHIMPGVFIGHHVVIGDNCVIHPHVTIYDHCIIGNNVIIHSGAVLGADAFYYNSKKNRDVWYKKMESCGRVVIEDDVEIGGNTCIDRGVTHDTRIMQGTKLDNLVQIGHDVVIGRNCIIAAQVGIAGATTVGNGVSLWGQVGVSKTLRIGDNAQVLAQSGIPSDIEGGKVYWGTPVEEAGIKRRELVWIKRIPEMWDKLKRMP